MLTDKRIDRRTYGCSDRQTNGQILIQSNRDVRTKDAFNNEKEKMKKKERKEKEGRKRDKKR